MTASDSWESVMGIYLKAKSAIKSEPQYAFYRQEPLDYGIPKAKGMDKCPCETPKCRLRERCEEANIMCLAFEEWSTMGKYKAKIGKWFVPIVDIHHASKSNGAGKRARQIYFQKIYTRFKEGASRRDMAREFNVTERSINMIISRQKRKEFFGEKRYGISEEVHFRDAQESGC